MTLAWLFVVARTLHAAVYIGFNRLAYRFALFASSCVVLGVLWIRFALQSWPAA
ncbi:MAG: MAPEG family protein [Acidobacteriota bacterium]|nr:MAPEG family protein [Acidobacteriota bacterium]